MKKCFKCGETKSLDDFYKHPAMPDGHLNKCKDCAKKDAIANRLERLEYYREYDRNRANQPQRIALRKKVSEIWAKDGRGAEAIRRYRKAHPEQYVAHGAVNNAVRDGRLSKPKNCLLCGFEAINLQAHHSDYFKPLDVMWLCIPCHSALHKEKARMLRQKHKLLVAN